MRVLLLPTTFLPEHVGGTEIYTARLAQALTQLDIETHIAFSSASTPPKEGDWGTASVHTLPPRKSPTRTQLRDQSLGEPPREFEALLDRVLPDLVHFHSFSVEAGIDHAELLYRRGIPYAVTVHYPGFLCAKGNFRRTPAVLCSGVYTEVSCAQCLSEHEGIPPLLAKPLSQATWSASRVGPLAKFLATRDLSERFQRAARHFLGRASLVITPANWLGEVIAANCNRTALKIPYSLPVSPTRSTLRLPLPAHVRIGFAGRMSADKGVPFLQRALAPLSTCFESHTMEWVGPIETGVPSPAGYRGVKTGEEFKKWLTSLDLLIVPSEGKEVGPLVVLEAWAVGVPTLGANHSGIRELFEEQGLTDLLFSSGDVESLVEAAQRARLLRTPSEIRFFPFKEFAEAHRDAYRSCLST